MKKILFGSAAAILAVVGLSSFKNLKSAQTVYYFKLTHNSSITPGSPLFNAYGTVSTIAPAGCAGGANLCIVTVTVGKLTVGKQVLTTANGPVTYASTIDKQN